MRQVVLLSRYQIQERVAQLADEIYGHYFHTCALEQPIVAISVLAGSYMFAADLVRILPMAIYMDFIKVSTYPNGLRTPRQPQILSDASVPVFDRHVLLIDDILDSGKTLGVVQEKILSSGPASLKTAVLLRKPNRLIEDVAADFVGFDIPDEFVFGYGLDNSGLYRNLQCVVAFKE